MGVLTDFVVMARTDAQRVCDSHCPSRDFAGLDAKGIDTVKLATLYAVLTGREYDPSFMSQPLSSGGDEGPWVFEVPGDLAGHLAKLDTEQLSSVAAKWAATEEFLPKYGRWPPEAVRQVLDGLAGLCRKAVSEDKTVLMWMTL